MSITYLERGTGLNETRGAYLIPVTGTFDTREGAQAAVEAYYRDFHPAGYGTHLTMIAAADKWQVVGHRFASCD